METADIFFKRLTKKTKYKLSSNFKQYKKRIKTSDCRDDPEVLIVRTAAGQNEFYNVPVTPFVARLMYR